MTVLLPALQPKTLSLNSAIQRRLATYTHTARISWPSLGRCPGLVLDMKSTNLPESSRIQPVTLANPVGLLGLVLKPVFATLAHSACPTPLVVLVPKFPHFRAAPRGSHVPVRLKPLPMKPCASRRATLQVTLSRCCHMSLITTFSRTCGPLVYRYFQQPHSFQRIAKDSRCAHVSLPGCCKCNSPRPHSRPCASNCPRGMAPRRPAVHPCHLCRTLTWLSRKMAIEPRWKLSARQSSNHCCKSWGFRFLVQCSPCHGKTSRCLDLHFSLKYFRARAASHQPSGLQAWMPLALTSKRFLGLMFRPSCLTSPPLKKSLLHVWLQNPRLKGFWAAPACGTCSAARNIPRFAPDGTPIDVPKPLRSRRFPDGLPFLAPPDARRVDLANASYQAPFTGTPRRGKHTVITLISSRCSSVPSQAGVRNGQPWQSLTSPFVH